MPKNIKTDDPKAGAILQFTHDELSGYAEGSNGTLFEESEIPGSDKWLDPKDVLKHIPSALSARGLIELHIKIGKPWVVRRVVQLSEVVAPEKD